MNRRQFLLTGAAGAAMGVAGCLGDDYPTIAETERVAADALATPTLGAEDADVTMKVFQDFKCGHCRSFKLNVLPRIKEEYLDSNEITYEAWDYPVLGDDSYRVANAARYVQDVGGNDDYWDVLEYIYDNQDAVPNDALHERAAEYGGTVDEAERATNGVYHNVIEANRDHGGELGVSGTPYVLVNGQRPDGNTFDKISEHIDSEL